MSGVFTKDDENPVCHPEFISGSQTVQGQEILKRVQNDRKDGGIFRYMEKQWLTYITS